MRTRYLYTMNRPEAELIAIQQLIAKEALMDTEGLKIYSLSAKKEYGRIYYGICDPETETGLLFTISPLPRSEHTAEQQRQIVSEWEIKDLFKLARLLGMFKFRMLGPLRLYDDEIKALAQTPA